MVYCVRISYTNILLVALVYRASFLLCCPAPTVYRAVLSPCCLYTDIHTASTIYRHALPLSAAYRHAHQYINIQTQHVPCPPCPAPLHMPLKRSYFASDGLLLLGYKYKGSTNKTRYSLNMAVSRLCCAWVGWGIYDILRGAGYSLHHTPHIKRGNSPAAPLLAFCQPSKYQQVTGKLPGLCAVGCPVFAPLLAHLS